MGLNWPSGGDSGKEATPNWERWNKWTDSTIPISGTEIVLSGSGSRLSRVLSGSVLHILVSKNDCHVTTGTGPLLTASYGNQFWPANTPIYHIPKSGSTDRIAVVNDAATNVECWIAPAEYTDE